MTPEALGRSLRAMVSTWQGWFILGFIALQLAAPLHYYAMRRDAHDERFAWRMFSPMRMVRCQTRFTVDDKPIGLGSRFHEAWIKLADRGRFSVIEAMGARLCRDNPGKRVVVDLTCRHLDDEQEHWGGFDMCQVPEL